MHFSAATQFWAFFSPLLLLLEVETKLNKCINKFYLMSKCASCAYTVRVVRVNENKITLRVAVSEDLFAFGGEINQNMTKYRSSHRWCSINKVFLKISQISQENNCARASFLIKRHWHRRFSMNFAKFSRTSFLQNTFG